MKIDTYLIEFKHVQQFKQFFIFFVLFKFNVMLLQTVQRQLGLVVYVHFHGLNKKIN